MAIDRTLQMIAEASAGEQGSNLSIAGDQTGCELRIRQWYSHSSRWGIVYRIEDLAIQEKIAQFMEKITSNGYVGYDQTNRDTLDIELKKVNFNPQLLRVPCETDCSMTAYEAVKYATGISCEGINTGELKFYDNYNVEKGKLPIEWNSQTGLCGDRYYPSRRDFPVGTNFHYYMTRILPLNGIPVSVYTLSPYANLNIDENHDENMELAMSAIKIQLDNSQKIIFKKYARQIIDWADHDELSTLQKTLKSASPKVDLSIEIINKFADYILHNGPIRTNFIPRLPCRAAHIMVDLEGNEQDEWVTNNTKSNMTGQTFTYTNPKWRENYYSSPYEMIGITSQNILKNNVPSQYCLNINNKIYYNEFGKAVHDFHTQFDAVYNVSKQLLTKLKQSINTFCTTNDARNNKALKTCTYQDFLNYIETLEDNSLKEFILQTCYIKFRMDKLLKESATTVFNIFNQLEDEQFLARSKEDTSIILKYPKGHPKENTNIQLFWKKIEPFNALTTDQISLLENNLHIYIDNKYEYQLFKNSSLNIDKYPYPHGLQRGDILGTQVQYESNTKSFTGYVTIGLNKDGTRIPSSGIVIPAHGSAGHIAVWI